MNTEFINILCELCGKPIRIQRPITKSNQTCTDYKKEISSLNKEYWEDNSSEMIGRAYHSDE